MHLAGRRYLPPVDAAGMQAASSSRSMQSSLCVFCIDLHNNNIEEEGSLASSHNIKQANSINCNHGQRYGIDQIGQRKQGR